MSASQQRQDLIARTFAETAIKRLYRLVYRAIKRAATGPVSYWTGRGNGFASCDPTQWPDELELSVDVVGIGNREQALGHLSMVGTLQEKLIALQGGRADGPFVTAENVANGAQKLTEVLGYKTAGVFFQPAERVAAARVEATPAASVDPALLAAQAQIAIQREAAQADIHQRPAAFAAKYDLTAGGPWNGDCLLFSARTRRWPCGAFPMDQLKKRTFTYSVL